MSEKKANRRRNFLILLVGLILVLFVGCMMDKNALTTAEELAKSTVKTLEQQCESFNNIKSVNKTNSLFNINECLTELSRTIERSPSLASDEYLEEFVDNMFLSGVAVLDGNLVLEASGYTRQFREKNWKDRFYAGCFESMVHHPEQVVSERIRIDGIYYDICGVSRRDKPGVIIGYYKQPQDLIYDTERDLANLIKGIHMSMDGEFLIEYEGSIVSDNGQFAEPKKFIEKASNIFVDDVLKAVKYGGREYYGTRTIKDDYAIYVYFPTRSIFAQTVWGILIFILVYTGFWLVISAVKSKSLKSKQKQLEETNKKLTETVNSLQSLKNIYFTVFYVDIEKDTYESLFFSGRVGKIIPPSGKYSESLKDLVNETVLEIHRENVLNKLRPGYVREVLNRKKERSFFVDYEIEAEERTWWCRATMTVVDEKNEKPNHVLLMLQDIDEEKIKEMEYQKKILKESEAANAANRAKSTFLFNMSHDIRTPMNAILGYADLAQKNIENTDKLKHYMKNIHVSGKRMISLIDEILEVARIENNKLFIKKEPVKAGEGLKSCIMMVKLSADEKNIKINYSENIIYPYVYIDHPHLSRVALNILTNAVKFTPNGGQIDCIVNHEKSETEGECITEFIISDNGIGMSEDFITHIYEPFAREKSETVSGIGGTGLGMGIVKKIVDLMDGTIDLESKPGEGTAFKIRIPCKIASESDIEPLKREYEVDKSGAEGGRILLAEDNDLNAEIITEILVDAGFLVDRAENGEECLKILEESESDYYHLILMDVQMPVMDGYTATKAIRGLENGKKSEIPIVAMTANAFPEDRKKELEAGMNGHISKPIDVNKLFVMLERQLGVGIVRKNTEEDRVN